MITQHEQADVNCFHYVRGHELSDYQQTAGHCRAVDRRLDGV